MSWTQALSFFSLSKSLSLFPQISLSLSLMWHTFSWLYENSCQSRQDKNMLWDVYSVGVGNFKKQNTLLAGYPSQPEHLVLFDPPSIHLPFIHNNTTCCHCGFNLLFILRLKKRPFEARGICGVHCPYTFHTFFFFLSPYIRTT